MKYASEYWIEHLHSAFTSTYFHDSWYDSLGEKLEMLTRQGSRTWFNTLLLYRGVFETQKNLQVLHDILQKAKVSLPLVFVYLNSHHGNPLGHTRIPT